MQQPTSKRRRRESLRDGSVTSLGREGFRYVPKRAFLPALCRDPLASLALCSVMQSPNYAQPVNALDDFARPDQIKASHDRGRLGW